MSLVIDDVYAGEFGCRLDGIETTLRLSGGGFTTLSTDTPPSTPYLPGLSHALMLARTAFADRQTSGHSAPSAGEVDAINDQSNPIFDSYRRAQFDGRPAVLYRGQLGAAFPSAWTRVMSATKPHTPLSWCARG